MNDDDIQRIVYGIEFGRYAAGKWLTTAVIVSVGGNSSDLEPQNKIKIIKIKMNK